MRTFLAILALSALIAAPVRADVVDSGSLVIGLQGIIGGTMTIQGSAFSVGASTLTVSSGKVGIGTAAPTAVLSVVGDAVFNGTMTFAPLIHKSSSIIRTVTTSFTNTTYACISGHVATMTVTGGDVAVFFSAEVANNTANADSVLGFRMDGAALDGADALIGWTTITASYAFPASFYQVVKGVSPGSHWWCLSGRVTGGTADIIGDTGSFARKNVFGVMELK
ncbi:MAG: hypothetical protein HYZ75_08175 [Elusimicrobia bacterium]|nr:hypothetical protein [Elusimicrobiota bacterium]